jgi:hypothetical protein
MTNEHEPKSDAAKMNLALTQQGADASLSLSATLSQLIEQRGGLVPIASAANLHPDEVRSATSAESMAGLLPLRDLLEILGFQLRFAPPSADAG